MPWSDVRVLRVIAPAPELRELEDNLASQAAYVADLRLKVETTVSDRARTMLVGFDGGTKMDRPVVVPLAEVFAAIESMPMRVAEMRNRS